jgi:hypothetical protein
MKNEREKKVINKQFLRAIFPSDYSRHHAFSQSFKVSRADKFFFFFLKQPNCLVNKYHRSSESSLGGFRIVFYFKTNSILHKQIFMGWKIDNISALISPRSKIPTKLTFENSFSYRVPKKYQRTIKKVTKKTKGNFQSRYHQITMITVKVFWGGCLWK